MSYDGSFSAEEVWMVESGVREDTWRKRRSCRHKAPSAVEKRNARERRRVEAVNGAFLRLRKAVPADALSHGPTAERSKRVSKVKTLHRAIEYISRLEGILRNSGCSIDHCERRFFQERCCEGRSCECDESSVENVWHEEMSNDYQETRVDCIYDVIPKYDREN